MKSNGRNCPSCICKKILMDINVTQETHPFLTHPALIYSMVDSVIKLLLLRQVYTTKFCIIAGKIIFSFSLSTASNELASQELTSGGFTRAFITWC